MKNNKISFTACTLASFIIGILSGIAIQRHMATENINLQNENVAVTDHNNESVISPTIVDKFTEQKSISFIKAVRMANGFPFKIIITKENISEVKRFFISHLGDPINEFNDRSGNIILYFYDKSNQREFIGYEIKLFTGSHFECRGVQINEDGSFAHSKVINDF